VSRQAHKIVKTNKKKKMGGKTMILDIDNADTTKRKVNNSQACKGSGKEKKREEKRERERSGRGVCLRQLPQFLE
jgi:hypothetical protein